MKQRGLTLIEIIITVLILGMISLFIAMLIFSTFQTYESTLQESEVFSNVSIIMDKLARDIRQGRLVQNISPYTLTIQLSDGNVYTYSVVIGKDGKKYFAVNGQILAGPIQDLTFTGLDANMIYTSIPENVRMVAYTLTTLDGRKLTSNIGLRAEVVKTSGGVIITEILYSDPLMPPGRERRYYFIEIQNMFTKTISLQNWRIYINGTYYSFQYTPTPWLLLPGQIAVIGGSSFDPNNFLNPRPSYVIKLSSDISFNTTSNTVSIVDNFNNIVDSITYTSGWGGKFDSNTYSWYSMERIDYTIATQVQSNWTDSRRYNISVKEGSKTYNIYCTPGAKNSVSP